MLTRSYKEKNHGIHSFSLNLYGSPLAQSIHPSMGFHPMVETKKWWDPLQDQTLDIMTYDHKSLENNFQLGNPRDCAGDPNLLRILDHFWYLCPTWNEGDMSFLYSYIYIYTYVYIYIHMYMYVYIHTHTHIFVFFSHCTWLKKTPRTLALDPSILPSPAVTSEAQVSHSGLWPWNLAQVLDWTQGSPAWQHN